MTSISDLQVSALEGLSPEQKRELLRRLLREREAQSARPAAPAAAEAWPTVVPDPAGKHEPFALTDIQHAYWLGRADGLELGGVGSHVYCEFDLPLIDPARMERAWQAVVDRHGMLRTVILPGGLQRVLEHVPPVQVPFTDLSRLPPADQQAALQAGREARQARRYDPHEWPMFDLRTFRLSADDDHPLSRVCLSFDMLILDLRSLQIVLEEWFAYYQDPGAHLPPLPISFRDYRLAEAQIAHTALPEASRAYWAARLPHLPPAPALPQRRGPDALDPESTEGRAFRRRSARLSPAEWQALKDAASTRGLTPAAALLGAFGEVLAAWSGETRFTLTLTIFNRLPLHPAVPRLVGDFTSTNLLAFDLGPTEPFSTRAARVQRQLFEDLEHRLVSGVQVLRDLARDQGARWALRPMVFTSHLAGAGAGGDTFTPHLPAEIVWGLSQTPQVSLDYQVFEHGGGLNIQWDAREALFPVGLLDDMFTANLALLRDLTVHTRAWSATQHALAPAAHLARRGPHTAPFAHDPFTSPRTLPDLFVAQARARPDAPAVIAGGQTLTYGELDARSAELAAQLHRSGVARDAQRRPQPVAVVCGRGWEAVVAVLAVLRAGGAYLPLDPELPPERLRDLLLGSGTRQVLTQPHLRSKLDWPAGLAVSAVESHAPPGEAPDVEVRPADLAYIIYTSGSTGTPKGVMIDHRGAVNTVLDVNDRYGVGPSDRVLGVSALTFDLSVYDLFGTFAAGGTLVLPDNAGRRDPQHWLALAQRHGVTVWNSVPALLEMLLGVLPPAGLPTLRLALLSGDWIPLSLPPAVRRQWPQVTLVSLGGATEASIWSILHDVTDFDPQWASVPYGRAMRHQSVQVLDAQLNPAPDLVPGELYIGGVGVALGYWQDAERSAERFIMHPRSGERLYRTGDLGRTLPDGTVELLGRVDRQVKVRGHRIELGEIESAIREVPGVRDALVTVRRTAGRAAALTAYLIPDHPAAGDPAASPDDVLAAELAAAAAPLRPYRSGDPALDAALALQTTLEERAAFGGKHPVPVTDPSGAAVPLGAADGPVAARLRERRSFRHYSLQAVTAGAFTAWLGALLPDAVTGRSPYASAGGTYAVQVYVWVRPGRVEGLDGGVYALDVPGRALRAVPGGGDVPREAYDPLVTRPMFDESAFAVFLVAELRAIAPVYGDLSRHFATLEAGLMTGVLEAQAAGTALGVCQVGVVDDASVRRSLNLGVTQLLVHSLMGGRLDEDLDAAARPAGPADLRAARRLDRLLERVLALDDAQVAAALAALDGPA